MNHLHHITACQVCPCGRYTVAVVRDWYHVYYIHALDSADYVVAMCVMSNPRAAISAARNLSAPSASSCGEIFTSPNECA